MNDLGYASKSFQIKKTLVILLPSQARLQQGMPANMQSFLPEISCNRYRTSKSPPVDCPVWSAEWPDTVAVSADISSAFRASLYSFWCVDCGRSRSYTAGRFALLSGTLIDNALCVVRQVVSTSYHYHYSLKPSQIYRGSGIARVVSFMGHSQLHLGFTTRGTGLLSRSKAGYDDISALALFRWDGVINFLLLLILPGLDFSPAAQ